MLRNNLTFFCLECVGSSGFLPSRKLTVFESIEYLVENFCFVSIALDEQVNAWKRLSITCGTHPIRRRLSRRLS